KSVGGRCFSSAAPSLWNKLPQSIRLSSHLLEYKSKLKTHFFRKAFNDMS
ncbi:hypothetical protein CAPTEDRAFT_141814, partial [Capitella teleta]